MPTPTYLRVVIYARVSSEEQSEGQTIDSQVAELERFAATQGWIVTGIYKDEGWSGAVLARPALDRLRDDASKSLFDLVLLNDVDRLARDVSHLGIIKRDLERKRVQVRFRKLPAEQSPTANLMVNILGSFAEFERELIADRTRRGRRHKVEVRQEFLGSLAPYGYRYITKRVSGSAGHLEVDPEEAIVVREMFRWVAQEGLSAMQVMRRLTQNKIPPRKGGAKWGKSSVIRILRCETYTGIWYYNKNETYEPSYTERSGYRRSLKYLLRRRPKTEWIGVQLPPSLHLVSRAQWEQVQAQLTRNRTYSPRNTKHSYLLSGLVRCGGCGATYVGDPGHGKFYYRCLKRCRQYPTIREEKLNEIVWETTKSLLLTPTLITEQLQMRDEEARQKARFHENEQAEIQQALETLQEQESRIVEAYRTGVLTLDLLQHELAELHNRKERLTQRQMEIGSEKKDGGVAVSSKNVEEVCQTLARQADLLSESEKQQFLRLLIKKIIFTGHQITIQGLLPSLPRLENEALTEQGGNFSGSRITTTEIYLDGRNAVIETVEPEGIPFELRSSIPMTKPLFKPYNLEFVKQLVAQYPQATLKELATRVEREKGFRVPISSMHRVQARLGLRRKDRRAFKEGVQ